MFPLSFGNLRSRRPTSFTAFTNKLLTVTVNVVDPDPDWIRILIGSVDPDPDSDYPAVPRKTKMTTKKKKILRKIEKRWLLRPSRRCKQKFIAKFYQKMLIFIICKKSGSGSRSTTLVAQLQKTGSPEAFCFGILVVKFD
jgi:hypothetical protein